MTNDKRARQKANRANRIAAAQAAAAKARVRRRMIWSGLGAGVIAVAVVGVLYLIGRGDDGSTVATTDSAELTTDLADPATDLADSYPTTPEPPVPEPPVPEPTVLEPTVSDPTAPEAPVLEPEIAQPALSPEITEPSHPDCPAPDKSSPRTIDFDGPQPMCINPSHNYIAVFDTSEGEIVISLDTANTPNTVNNFVTLARWGYYDGTTLFRTDPSIDIIQGGSPHTNSASDPGPGYTIPDEPTFTDTNGTLTGPYRYVPGQLVMARSAGPDSSGAQFFFTTGNNTSLLDSQGTYIVFGQTDQVGLGVMQDIIALHQPDNSGLGGSPSRTVTVNSVTILVS